MALIEHPGCYGLPSAVCHTSPSCQVCPSRAGCVLSALNFAETLPNSPLTKRLRLSLVVTRTALASSPRALDLSLGSLPAKVAIQVKELTRSGWFDFARHEMQMGRNPADKGWKKVFCAELLTGGATRGYLQQQLVEQLGLSKGSAQVQTSIGISIFAAGRLASERFGQFKLSPRQNAED